MRTSPLLLLAVGLALVAASYGLAFAGGGALAPWGLALGSTSILSALLWLGARRRGRAPRALGIVIGVVAVATAGGFAIALLSPPPAVDTPLLLGLPRVTACMLLLTGLVPLLLLPLAYALRFERDILADDT